MLWLGDNLYLQTPDFLDPSSMAARYRQARSFAPLQKLLTATAHLAILDDHDFGPNDADGSYVLKGETLKLFERYWPNPTLRPARRCPARSAWARVGDVEFFLLDDRTYRYPDRYPDVAGEDDVRRRAVRVAEAGAHRRRARAIKLVAAGGQFWNRASRFEGLHQFPQEQKRLARVARSQQRIDGVIFLSGDRHFGELLKIERAGAYPLYEFTSSPLTSRPWPGPMLRNARIRTSFPARSSASASSA